MAVAPPQLPPLADAATGGRQLAAGVFRRCRASAASVDWRDCLSVSVEVAEESGWGAAFGGGGGPGSSSTTTTTTTPADGGGGGGGDDLAALEVRPA